MMQRVRLVMIMARPAVAVLLGMFAAIGLAQTGHTHSPLLLARVLVVVVGFLLFSVACNDIADEAIDRINLPGDRWRPLVTGTGGRRELMTIGVTSAVLAVATSTTLGWPAILVTVVGFVLSTAYSLRPVRLADRGAIASLVLPACYVAVPYLIGVFAGRPYVRASDLALLAGLYLGFLGRILLKDFRDVRGDALFGKRTFLVRHGRGPTCVFSACCTLVGPPILVAAVYQPTLAFAAACTVCVVALLALLRSLAVDKGPRRDEKLIAAIALIGRGVLLLLLAHLSMAYAHWQALAYHAVLVTLLVLAAGPAVSVLRHGSRTRTTVPPDEAATLQRTDTARR